MTQRSIFSLIQKRLFFFSILLAAFSATAQKSHYIDLSDEKIEIENRGFFVEKVVDDRYSKGNLGWVREGFFKSKVPVDFENSLTFSLKKYFDTSLPQKQGQIPLTLVFKVLKTSEDADAKRPSAYADVRVEFFQNDLLLFRTDEHAENSGEDIHRLLETTLSEALAKSLRKFNESDWREKIAARSPENVIDNKFENPDATHFVQEKDVNSQEGPITYDEEELKKLVPENRNVFVLGLGMGGISFIGVEYELRLTDLFGINAGAGYFATDFFGNNYFSYSAGVKIHTGPTKNSSFIHLSYKDAGFGLLGTVGAEYGDRVALSKKKDLGLVWQVGMGIITHMDDERGTFYTEDTILLITGGIGLSFNIGR